MALSRTAQGSERLRALGIMPLTGDLDDPGTLTRLSALGQRILHLAPPPQEGWHDARTVALLRVLMQRGGAARMVYGSTSGVYGDCGGALVSETRTPRADTPRARRRHDAEQRLRWFARVSGAPVSILRIPGIYALDREGGTPRERLLKGMPVLQSADDVYTNHIHADDLARACDLALWRGRPQRIYNVNDDSRLRMGDYFDLAADLFGLPRPPRVPRSTAEQDLPLMVLSFMRESRLLDNRRVKNELRLRLQYPSVADGLKAAR